MDDKEYEASTTALANLQQSVDALVRVIADSTADSVSPDPLSWSDDRFCTRDETCRLAQAMGVPVSKSQLERFAVWGGGPPITYFGLRKPLYTVGEFKTWVVSRTRKARSTADIRRANRASRWGKL